MAPTLVSEEQRATRLEMSHASGELAIACRGLATRLEAYSELARRLNSTANLLRRLQAVAEGSKPLDQPSLIELGNLYLDLSIKLSEANDLASSLPSRAVWLHLTLKIATINGIASKAFHLAI